MAFRSSSPLPTPRSASALRRELSARALSQPDLPAHEQTYGTVPSIVYTPDEAGRSHGNFLPGSYRRILANPAWHSRLSKAYTASRRLPRTHDRTGRAELDCANSSDALLMNIFCYPGLLARPALQQLLALPPGTAAEFGVRLPIALRAPTPTTPRPRRNQTTIIHQTTACHQPKAGDQTTAGNQTEAGDQTTAGDRTEIDLRLDNLLVEAKLTETDFQTAPARLVHRYRDLDEVFAPADLPRSASGAFSGYQLIRGALAAHATHGRFAVLCDNRRADLAEQWFAVLRAVRFSSLRSRLQLITWQELAATTPPRLQHFLATKYGIVATA